MIQKLMYNVYGFNGNFYGFKGQFFFSKQKILADN